MNISKSRQVIIRSALLIVAFIGVMALTSLFYMQNLNNEIEQIDERYNQKVQILFEMSQIIRDRSFDLFSIYLSDDDWRIDDVYMQFNQKAAEFVQLREQLLGIGLTAEQNEELEKVFAIINKTQPLQEKIVERIRDGKRKDLRAIISEEDIPLENQVYNIFGKLTVLAIKEASAAHDEIEKKYKNAIWRTLLLAVISVIFTVFVMRYSMEKIHANEMDINWDAEHDPLTNVYNRRWLNKYFSANERPANKEDRRLNKQVSAQGEFTDGVERHAVLYIDLDNFKPVNDLYGHNAGDKVLVEVVRIIKECIRQSDVVIRVGGDEFVVLLESCTRGKSAQIAKDILDHISGYEFYYGEQLISGVSCSIGVGFINQQTSWPIALEIADSECNKVKHSGKASVSIH